MVVKEVHYTNIDNQSGVALYTRVDNTIYLTWKDGKDLMPILASSEICQDIYNQEQLAFWDTRTVLSFIGVLFCEHTKSVPCFDYHFRYNLMPSLRDPARPAAFVVQLHNPEMPKEIYDLLKSNANIE